MTTAPARTGAMLARGKSKQTYQTPRDFLDAVEAKFGRITWDLAALQQNAVGTWNDHKDAPYFGPSHPRPSHRNALSPDCIWPTVGVNWLNPPFDDIAPWAEKCAAWKPEGMSVTLLLTPASVASNWFAMHVHRKAFVMPLSPRLTFVGETHPYPKDLMLSVFSNFAVGFEPWRWCVPVPRRRLRRVV